MVPYHIMWSCHDKLKVILISWVNGYLGSWQLYKEVVMTPTLGCITSAFTIHILALELALLNTTVRLVLQCRWPFILLLHCLSQNDQATLIMSVSAYLFYLFNFLCHFFFVRPEWIFPDQIRCQLNLQFDAKEWAPLWGCMLICSFVFC